jgi:hypothetical protein
MKNYLIVISLLAIATVGYGERYDIGEARIYQSSKTVSLRGTVFAPLFENLDVEPLEIGGCSPTSEGGGCVNPYVLKDLQHNAFACGKPLDARTEYGCSGSFDFEKDAVFSSSGAVFDLSRVLKAKNLKKLKSALIAAYGNPYIRTADGTGLLNCSSQSDCSITVNIPKIACNDLPAPNIDVLTGSMHVGGIDAQIFYENLDLPVQQQGTQELKGFRVGETIFECAKEGTEYSCLFDDEKVGPTTYSVIDFNAVENMPQYRKALENLSQDIGQPISPTDLHPSYKNATGNFTFNCSTLIRGYFHCQIQADAYASCLR